MEEIKCSTWMDKHSAPEECKAMQRLRATPCCYPPERAPARASSRAGEDNDVLYIRGLCKHTRCMADRLSKRVMSMDRLSGSVIVGFGFQCYTGHHLNRLDGKSAYRCFSAEHHGIGSIKNRI